MKNLIFSILIFMIGCAPAPFIPRKPPDIKFEKTVLYVLDLSKIPKPDKLKPIWMDSKFNQVDSPDKASFVVLSPQEYAKVGAIVKLAKNYKSIAKEQETLINIYIDQINALKEYVALEKAKSEEYRNLWIDSENKYRQEVYSHKMDNILYKGVFGIISVGALVLAIIAL